MVVSEMKAISCASYDQYSDENKPGLKDDVIDLELYLQLVTMVLMLPCCMSHTHSAITVPGESTAAGTYPMQSEEAKLLSCSLLMGIKLRDDEDESFGYFDIKKLKVTKAGSIKFHHVNRYKKTEALLIQSLLNAHKVLTRIYTKDNHPIPVDIQHLLDNILKNTLAYFGMFHIHASLAPRPTRFAVLLKLYEWAKFNLSEPDRKKVFSKLPYIDTWKQTVPLNALLAKTYNYAPGSYKDPVNKSPQELSEIKGEKFGDFLRNNTSHRMESLSAAMQQAPPPPPPPPPQAPMLKQQPGPPFQQQLPIPSLSVPGPSSLQPQGPHFPRPGSSAQQKVQVPRFKGPSTQKPPSAVQRGLSYQHAQGLGTQQKGTLKAWLPKQEVQLPQQPSSQGQPP